MLSPEYLRNNHLESFVQFCKAVRQQSTIKNTQLTQSQLPISRRDFLKLLQKYHPELEKYFPNNKRLYRKD